MAEMTFLRSCAEHPVAADFTEVNTFFKCLPDYFFFFSSDAEGKSAKLYSRSIAETRWFKRPVHFYLAGLEFCLFDIV